MRSAVYHGAALSRRQAAHRAIADALDGPAEADRRAWHLAAASIEPNPAVVAELVRAAERARRRSAFAAASRAFERAAALSGDEHDRASHLAAAGENAWLAGRTERASSLLVRARPLASTPILRATIDRTLALIQMTIGVPADACRLALRAAVDVVPIDGGRALELLSIASVAGVYAGDRDAAVEIAEVVSSMPATDEPGSRQLRELLCGLGAFFAGDMMTAGARLRGALTLEGTHGTSATGDRPVALLFAGRAALFLGDDDAVSRTHQAAAAEARAGGAIGLLTQILPRLGYSELCAGRWTSAAASAREGLELARDLGQHDLVAYQLVLLALIAAHRGEEEQCRRLAAEGHELATARRFALVADFAHWALVVLELGFGRADDAFLRARAVADTGAVYWAGLDRIEAAARAGEPGAARDWLADFEQWADGMEADWARAVALHGQALLSDGDQAEALFRTALAIHEQAARPFERARTELAFGEVPPTQPTPCRRTRAPAPGPRRVRDPGSTPLGRASAGGVAR